jgi:hypothetical protein
MAEADALLNQKLNRISQKAELAVTRFVLSSGDIPSFRSACVADGRAALTNACITISQAIGDIDRKCFSWACVKFYYATFYCVKSWLLFSDEFHCYIDRKPWYLLLRDREQCRKGRGNSHEFAFSRFVQRFGSLPILSQEVEADPVFDWMRHRREEVQYLRQAFADPASHELFKAWENRRGRGFIDFAIDVDGTSSEFAELFDGGRAMAAIPIRLCADLLRMVRDQQGFALAPEQLQHCGKICRLEGQPVARWRDLLAAN